MKKATRSPQDKKRLSLERDRRNTYGESDKGSRKLIPRAKARVNRTNRRATATILGEVVGVPDEVLDARSEDKVLGRAPKRWRKHRDQGLGMVLATRADPDLVDGEMQRDWRRK